MINLKLVKASLLGKKFCKQELQQDENSQAFDFVRQVSSAQPTVGQELALTLKINGFIVEASGNQIFEKSKPVTPLEVATPVNSLLDFMNSDADNAWLEARLLSLTGDIDLCTRCTFVKLMETYLKADRETDIENSCNKVSLDQQAEQLAYEYILGTPGSAFETSRCSFVDLTNILGITSSAIFQNLNPMESMINHELKQDSLFEANMRTLVEKEVKEFNPKTDSLFEMITRGRIETELYPETEQAEMLVQQLVGKETKSSSVEEDNLSETTTPKIEERELVKSSTVDFPSQVMKQFESDTSVDVSPYPDVVVKIAEEVVPDIYVKLAGMDVPALYIDDSWSASWSASYSSTATESSNSSSNLDESSRKGESPKKSTSAVSDELRKLQLELKKAQGEILSLRTENSQLKDEGVRLRKVAVPDTVSSTPLNPSPPMTTSVRTFPPVVYLIAAIIIGLIIGKFIL